ncbi:MAG: condensation domain-containing protein, partial [Acidobacteriota bacterium]
AHLADSRRGPFLRTGDLGFLHGEELFVTGRLKDLIILRGRNHYPQDFERTAEACHADLQPGGSAAVAVDAPAGERLVLILELERRRQARVDIEEVVGAVRQAIAEEHQAQVHDVVLIRAGTLPRTSSGKVRRRACAAAYVAGELAVVGSSGVSGERETAPALVFERAAFEALDPMARERWILDFLCQRVVAAAGLDPSRLDPQQPLTAAGFDSLMTVELANDLQTTLRVGLPLDQLLADKSLAELSRDLIARLAEDDTEASIDSIPSQTVEGLDLEAPLSHGQQALWLLQRLAPDSAAYHVTFAARLRGPVDSGALRRVAEGWLARHPGLRATFHLRDGQPYQRFDAGLDFAAVDAALWSRRQLDEGLLTEAERPFDLGAGPLLRLHLFRRAVGEIVMLLVVHHAVADFGSLQELLVELAETYASQAADPTGDQTPAVSLPPPLHYADYVRWQQNRVSGPHGERMWRYWESALADAETVLELPTDRPRPPTLSYRGAGLPYRVEEEAAKRLETLGRQHGATPYMVLLAVFQVLLGRTTGRQDLLVGSPLAGRGHRDLAQLVGYLVNPLPIRGDLRSGSQPRTPTFVEVLDRLRHRVAGALAHQDYPAPLLVEQLAPEREANRNPLFQVLFTLEQPRGELGDDFAGFMLGQVGSRMALGGLEMESVALERRWSQFDLALRLVRSGTQLVGEWIFSTDLFDAVTLARMAEHYSQLLATFSAQPQQRIGDASLLPRAERHQLVCEWNAGGFDPGAQGTTIGVPGTQSTLDRLIAAQAAATPEGVALVVGDARLSYAELDARAGALARRL